MTTTTMTISLPDEMTAFVEAQATREGYASPSEYFQALIREAQKKAARRELEAKLLEGLNSPMSEMTQGDWEALRQEVFDRSPEAKRELDDQVREALASGPAEPMTQEEWDSLEREVWDRHHHDQSRLGP